jgi:hypothetical protein
MSASESPEDIARASDVNQGERSDGEKNLHESGRFHIVRPSNVSLLYYAPSGRFPLTAAAGEPSPGTVAPLQYHNHLAMMVKKDMFEM